MHVPERLGDLAVSESGFVFDPYSGTTFSLNATGLAVLRSLMAGDGREAIVAALAETFEVGDADLHRDIDEFVGLLRESGLVPVDFSIEASS